jgi:hypothetical protein
VSLDLAKLENVRRLPDGRIRARCPACAAGGHDEKGEHLLVSTDGRFGCAVYPGDTSHRKTIWALMGSQTAKPIKVHSLGRLGRVAQTPAVLQGNILGRLGRAEISLAGKASGQPSSQNGLVSTSNLRGSSEGVPRVPTGSRMPHFTPGGTLVIPFDSPARFHWWKQGGMTPTETRQ